MARILMTTEATDDAGYEGIQDLANITADKAAIDKNPLFLAAENSIIAVLPEAADRDYAERPTVISILQFRTASYFKRGGGSVGGISVTEGSGDLKSSTLSIGQVTLRREHDVGSRSSRQETETLSTEDQADWLEEQAVLLLRSLGVVVEDETTDFVLLTDSRLEAGDDYDY